MVMSDKLIHAVLPDKITLSRVWMWFFLRLFDLAQPHKSKIFFQNSKLDVSFSWLPFFSIMGKFTYLNWQKMLLRSKSNKQPGLYTVTIYWRLLLTIKKCHTQQCLWNLCHLHMSSSKQPALNAAWNHYHQEWWWSLSHYLEPLSQLDFPPNTQSIPLRSAWRSSPCNSFMVQRNGCILCLWEVGMILIGMILIKNLCSELKACLGTQYNHQRRQHLIRG